jgi:hypothetical protein
VFILILVMMLRGTHGAHGRIDQLDRHRQFPLGAVPRVLVWDGEAAVGRWRAWQMELIAALTRRRPLPGLQKHRWVDSTTPRGLKRDLITHLATLDFRQQWERDLPRPTRHRETHAAIGLAMRAAAHVLAHQGISLCQHQVRELYFRIMSEQQHASPEEHPEFDAAGTFLFTTCVSHASRITPTMRVVKEVRWGESFGKWTACAVIIDRVGTDRAATSGRGIWIEYAKLIDSLIRHKDY